MAFKHHLVRLLQICAVSALPRPALRQALHDGAITTVQENLLAVVTSWPMGSSAMSASPSQESVWGAGVPSLASFAASVPTSISSQSSSSLTTLSVSATFVYATTMTTVLAEVLGAGLTRMATVTITDLVTTTARVTETDWQTMTDFVTVTDWPSTRQSSPAVQSSSSSSVRGSAVLPSVGKSAVSAPSSLTTTSNLKNIESRLWTYHDCYVIVCKWGNPDKHIDLHVDIDTHDLDNNFVLNPGTLEPGNFPGAIGANHDESTKHRGKFMAPLVTRDQPQSLTPFKTVISSLETHGRTTAQPFNTTVIPTPSSSISRVTTGTAVIGNNTIAAPTITMASQNIFSAIATGAPPPQIKSRGDHPVARQGINQHAPIQTNKFYANFFLGGRGSSTWTHPYSLSWAQGGGQTGSWGIAVSQIDRNMVAYGGDNPVVANASSYFINPIGLQYIVMSARELGNGTALTMDSLLAFSADVNLAPASGAVPMITFPLVQGMGFVTAIYNAGTPLLQSGIFFNTLTYGGIIPSTNTARYQAVLNDGSAWFIYVTPNIGNNSMPTLTLTNSSQIVANQLFTGSIQVAKNPNGTYSQAVYDATAGVYPLRGNITANVSGSVANYNFSWTKGGNLARSLLMFALPHHVESLSPYGVNITNSTLQLQTTTKGLATGVIGDSWTLVEEDLPYDMGFAPWSPALRSVAVLPANAQAAIKSAAGTELNEDFIAQTNLDSMYFSGKGLAKFAFAIYAANDLAIAPGVASAGLIKLKDAFSRFVNNTQIWPLVYDTAWGGAVSSGTYQTNNSGLDFGNTYYNDHHFHFGYFVYCAAVIGYLDPTWLIQGTNKDWVNMLLRDYANPSTDDQYFPFSRSFDWFHGHSWAKGLFESGDGKDQESSSEDAFASYAIKMWGRTVGDANMEARGNLMLAVQSRSLAHYYLMADNNTVQPSRFIPNKAVGILFENKCDHATYFGANPEYIEGIHMLPLNPSSTLTRQQAFVAQEWHAYFDQGRVDQVAGGWRGILYANLAIIDPQTSYNFFAQSNFSNAYLDGGASRTWYLAWTAGLGGAASD